MKLRSHIGTDGILQIQTPTYLKDTNVEVVVVIQPLADAEVATHCLSFIPHAIAAFILYLVFMYYT
ncbi:hypothetical protein [Nostoc sp.]